MRDQSTLPCSPKTEPCCLPQKRGVNILAGSTEGQRESRRRAENKIRDSSEKMTVAFCFYQSIVQRLHSWEANITREEEIAGIYSGDGELNP